MPILPAILQHGAHAASSNLVASFVSIAKRDFNDSINPEKLFQSSQRRWLQIIVCLCSALSMAIGLMAVYWFAKMKRKFRHKLIMLLISADLLRSVWLFAFTLVNLTRGIAQTTDPLCQASGFFLQVAYNMTDYAALAIAVHTALQIFRPGVSGGRKEETGLYRYRLAVYITTVLLAVTFSSLAFTRNGPAYIAQGPLCSLPLRPFWYRLALAWIPRYLIMLIILILYIALYIHVGRQFGSLRILKRFGFGTSSTSSSLFSNLNVFGMTSVSSRNGQYMDPDRSGSIAPSLVGVRNAMKTSARNSIRRSSDGTTMVNGSTSTTSGKSGMASLEVPKPAVLALASPTDSRQFSRDDDHIVSDHIIRQDHAPDAIPSPGIYGLHPSDELSGWNAGHNLEDLSQPMLTREMRIKRHQAMRQLRLLFIYPVFYFIFWLVPFILNLTNYSNYLVQHPPFALALLAFISIAITGATSSIIFTIRERPWCNTIGSDGTFWGSFRFWQHDPSRRSSNNIGGDNGSTSVSSSLRGLSVHVEPAIAAPTRSKRPTRASLFSLKAPVHQTAVLQDSNEHAPRTTLRQSMPGSSNSETPNLQEREKYWFDDPSGRISSDEDEDEDEEPGRSS